MDLEVIISTLVWAAIIQGLFLVGMYLFSKKNRSFANQLLGLFLFLIVYEGTVEFLPFDDTFGYSWYYFSLPEIKLFYPILFLHYVLEKLGRSGNYLRILRPLYFLAFAVVAITLINVILFVSTGNKIEDYLGEQPVEAFFMAHQYAAFLLIIASVATSIYEVIHYKKVVHRSFSDSEMLQINWLWQFIFAIIPVIILWGMNLVSIIIQGEKDYDLELATWGFVILFLYFVSFKAFKHKNLFEGIREKAILNGGDIAKNRKGIQASESIQISREEKIMIEKINDFMTVQKPYLDASLSMYQLSQQLNIPIRELSMLINHKLNKHFFDFVNEYRIKKAMEILSDPENKQMTILEVLYEVGFNSKSSFNTVFKKYTGQTPTQYRKGKPSALGPG